MYEFDRNKQTIAIEGKTYSGKDFGKIPDSGDKLFRRSLYTFLHEWFSDSPTLSVQTSGSTGIPKEILIEKDRMMQSARLTCSFLGLEKGDTALLCMDLKYIGAKMVVVRSLIAGLNLHIIPPSGNPLKQTDIPYDFAAMVPLQIYNSLQDEIEKERLSNIKHLIIGGGAIDPNIATAIHSFPNNVYSTYGMTETLSHIALRKLNGANASDRYFPFESVSLSLSDDNTLIIDAPLVNPEKLHTNDIAELLDDGSFRIIGRKDNIINSGGIKIQIEEVEKQLKQIIPVSFAISSLPDPKFGEIVVLVIEGSFDIDESVIANTLPPYSTPKKIISVDTIPLTENGKISRAKLKELILKAY
ncbi:AMP-binding protein [Dysgonomonas macrotermitis]|uniref:O-succinylbenzoic acid--CoA ligase n=1 Tax=Dysgonomonas macrotermitis TaxID=1346286 RepID=A0A1M5BI33_9BACT|nr:AMP-binding protein [Dysgonomonas macrotermitis]SHF42254.1 O-succinylbenzoic acid--CoA ligase [Dysgonomonas macrotermitis]